MRRHEPWIVFCTVLWLSACSTLPRPEVPVAPGNVNAARKEAEVRTRWVGVTKLWTTGCPAADAPGWRVRPLFPLKKGLDPKLKRSARNAKLHRFCVYEYKGKLPKDRQLELPRSISDRLRSVEPDRVALSGMATLKEATSGPFSQRFSEQVEIPSDLAVQVTSKKVRLVFLDTQPTGEWIPQTSGLSPHGYTLTHIAGHLAGPLICKNGSNDPCAVHVASRLALPLVSFQPWQGIEVKNTSTGGHRGAFVDLFDALTDEITAWQPTLAQPHMVINLSAGWDGEKHGGWEANLDPMSLIGAIHGLLQTAATQGILVIAAAGNERGGPNATGQPLLPGGWEKPFRLTGQGEWLPTTFDPPLVYAVSGVDSQNHPLVNTREKGEASRVAYADHVVVEDLHTPGQFTATLTGTSVASAVVSTIAAIVWSYRPELSSAEVMDILSDSGEPLPRKHDFSEPPPVQDVRRVTLCRALSSARGFAQPGCGAETGIAQGPFIAFVAPEKTSDPTSSFPSTAHTDLRDDPWIGPQPAMDPCPACVIDPPSEQAFLPPPTEIAVVADASLRSLQYTTPLVDSSKLLIEIPESWAAGALQQATLEIFGFHPSTGRKMRIAGYSIPVPATPLVSGDQLEVTFDQPAEPFQAALSFVLNPPEGAPPGTTRSVISPLFVNSSEN
jgi:hypothetical protein